MAHQRPTRGKAGGAPERGALKTPQASLEDLLKPPAEKVRYRLDGGALDASLLDQQAQERAQEISEMDNTQLRRFYSPVVALRDRALARRTDAEEIKAELALLKARIAYARARDNKRVPAQFVRLITAHVSSIDSIDDFIAFARHFEAVVAYHRALAESAKKEQRHG